MYMYYGHIIYIDTYAFGTISKYNLDFEWVFTFLISNNGATNGIIVIYNHMHVIFYFILIAIHTC